MLIESEDNGKTTITYHLCTYCYTIISFRLRNAPAAFHRALNTILLSQTYDERHVTFKLMKL